MYLSNFATKKIHATLSGETNTIHAHFKNGQVDTHPPWEARCRGPNLDTLDIWDHTYLTSDQSSDGDVEHLTLTADASEMEMLHMMEGSSQSLQRVLCSPGSPDF